MWGSGGTWVTLYDVISAPLTTWPVLTMSIILCVLSVILTLFVLLHKSKGGGLSDLFGGGVSTSMGGTSMAERNLDRLTIVMGLLWLASIIVLLVLYSRLPRRSARGRRVPSQPLKSAALRQLCDPSRRVNECPVEVPSVEVVSVPAPWERQSAARPLLASTFRTFAPTTT